MPFTWHIAEFDILPSTQDCLHNEYNEQRALCGAVVVADYQSQGKGRHGRGWASIPQGNLSFSFLIQSQFNLQYIGQFSVLASLATGLAIEPHLKTQSSLLLKWPNDVLLKRMKCAGILIDVLNTQDDVHDIIIGIGVNIAEAPIAGSSNLNVHTHKDVFSKALMKDILSQFNTLHDEWREVGFERIKQEWLKRSFNKGEHITVKTPNENVSGEFKSIDTLGGLIVICDKTNKEKTITSGEVLNV